MKQMTTSNYARDGFCIMEHLLSGGECDALKAEALRVIRDHAKPSATVYVGAAAVSDAFRQLADDPRIVDILKEIMTEGVAFLSDKIVFKSGAQRFASPWHVDAFYWPKTRPKISVWIPLDDAAADNGTLVVIPGSHLREWKPSGGDVIKTNKEFDFVIQDGGWAAGDEVVCAVPRGSAVFFSDRLVHGSCVSTSGRDRYTIISTYHAPLPEEPFDLKFPARHVITKATDR